MNEQTIGTLTEAINYEGGGGTTDYNELLNKPQIEGVTLQGNTLGTSAPTTSTVGVLGQLYTDTSEMHTYQCTAIDGDTYTWTQRW